MSEHILTHQHQAHKHQTHNHAASGWRIHCGVEVTESSTNKQHTLSPWVMDPSFLDHPRHASAAAGVVAQATAPQPPSPSQSTSLKGEPGTPPQTIDVMPKLQASGASCSCPALPRPEETPRISALHSGYCTCTPRNGCIKSLN
jgi:hypothetical protein